MAAAKKGAPSGTGPWTTFGLCLAAAGVPLGWCRLVSDEYILPEVVLLSAGVLIAAAGTAFPRRGGERPSLSTPLDRPMTAVLIAWALAAAFSIDPRYSLLGTYGGYTSGLWQVASCAALFQLTACADEQARRRVFKIALSAAMVVSAYAVLQAAGLDPLVAAADLPGHRAIATFGSPAFLGAYLVVWFPAALHWYLSESDEKPFGRWALALVAAGLLASVSRGAWLAAGLGSAVYLGLTGRLRRPDWSSGRWAGAVLVCASIGAWSLHALARRSALGLGRENERLAIWGVAVDIFRLHPWLGVGPDAFEQGLRQVRTEKFIHLLGQGYRLGHAHNDILQVLATTGIIGSAAYLWLIAGLAAAARRALAVQPDRARNAALAAGLTALFVNLQFNIVSLPAYASAAIASGLLLRARGSTAPDAFARRLRIGTLLLFAAVSTAYSLRLAAADREYKLARESSDQGDAMRLYQDAISMNSCELGYHLAYVNFLSAIAGKIAGAERLDAVDRIAGSGETAVACHPNDAVAHYILGTGALMQAIVGRRERLPVAEEQLDAALRLDPYRLDVLDWRRQAASLRGDKNLERELLERIAHVKSLR